MNEIPCFFMATITGGNKETITRIADNKKFVKSVKRQIVGLSRLAAF